MRPRPGALLYRVAEDFKAGRSPRDFPEEHYEADWDNRFHEKELNPIGRRGLGLEA